MSRTNGHLAAGSNYDNSLLSHKHALIGIQNTVERIQTLKKNDISSLEQDNPTQSTETDNYNLMLTIQSTAQMTILQNTTSADITNGK